MSPDDTQHSESVETLIDQLTALEASNPHSFAESLADNIMEPVAEETAAFRSEALAAKSLAAGRYLLERNAEQIVRHKRARDMNKVRGANTFATKVQYEVRILDQIVKGINARNGILTNSPNPRKRAERRWINEMLAAKQAGRLFELIEEEREKDKARKAKAKKARNAQRRART